MIKADERSKGQQITGKIFFGEQRYCMCFMAILLWNKVSGRWEDGQMDQTIVTETLGAQCSQSYRSILRLWRESQTCLREMADKIRVPLSKTGFRMSHSSSVHSTPYCFSHKLSNMWLITQLNRHSTPCLMLPFIAFIDMQAKQPSPLPKTKKRSFMSSFLLRFLGPQVSVVKTCTAGYWSPWQ